MEIGGFLKKLIDDYNLINKQQPLFEQAANKNVHYSIHDNYLRFWFRFIYKYSYILEAGGYQRLRQIVERDYTTYSGKVLEEWFRECCIESGKYTHLGYWHDRKGENEIDIIMADDIDKSVEICEVKRIQTNILTKIWNKFSIHHSKYRKNLFYFPNK